MKKQLRLTLQFSVTVDETALPATSSDPDDQAYNDRQRRLLHALLSDQEQFQAFLSQCVVTNMQFHNWESIILDDATTESILAPCIATLPENDQRFFKEVEQEGIFYENVEDMIECFQTELDAIDMQIEDTNP